MRRFMSKVGRPRPDDVPVGAGHGGTVTSRSLGILLACAGTVSLVAATQGPVAAAVAVNQPSVTAASTLTTTVLSGSFTRAAGDDIVAVGGALSAVPVASSDGSGTFSYSSALAGSFTDWAKTPGVKVLNGDFNHDGRNDIALLPGSNTSWWTTIPVAFSNGDGTFTVTNASSDFAGWAQAPGAQAVTGDFNHDGNTDIALAGAGGWTVIPVAFSNGDGTFTVTYSSSPDFAGWAYTPYGARLWAGDFNHDGKSDLALTSAGYFTTIPVAFSNGDGTFTVTNADSSGFEGLALTAGAQMVTGDFNHDGNADFALAGVGRWTVVPVAFSNGDGTFTVTKSVVSQFPGWAAAPGAVTIAGDFNGDGRTDLALTGASGWSTVPVAYSNGDGTFTVFNPTVIANFPQYAPAINDGATVATGDFNADGRTDLALVGGAGWQSVIVALSDGNGSFNAESVITGPSLGFAHQVAPAVPPHSAFPLMSADGCLSYGSIAEALNTGFPDLGNRYLTVTVNGVRCDASTAQLFQVNGAGYVVVFAGANPNDPSAQWTFRYDSPNPAGADHFHLVNVANPGLCVVTGQTLTTEVADPDLFNPPHKRIDRVTYTNLVGTATCNASATNQEFWTHVPA